jgi:hypothetical protein
MARQSEDKTKMEASEVRRAVDAAMACASALGLGVEDAIVLNDSNRLVLRLLPCDVIARVAPPAHPASAQLEVDVVRRLAETDSPVAAFDPRVEPRLYMRDGFAVSLWTHYEQGLSARELPAPEYAHALQRLHAGLREIDTTTQHFTDRVVETQQWVASHEVTPDLTDADRKLLADTLEDLTRSIIARGAAEQLLHGEPHPWNVLSTKGGLLFIDFENALRGPVEYDLGWVPKAVSEHYRDVDRELLDECRGLMLAIVAASHWRWYDEHPGNTARADWLSAVRDGPPWLAVDDV